MKMAVFDIDDTLFSWPDAEPIEEGISRLNQLLSEGYKIAYCTARPSNTRKETEQLIKQHNLPFDSKLLFMLKEQGDNVPRFKKDTVSELQKDYDVKYFFDDQKVIRSIISKMGVEVDYFKEVDQYVRAN